MEWNLEEIVHTIVNNTILYSPDIPYQILPVKLNVTTDKVTYAILYLVTNSITTEKAPIRILLDYLTKYRFSPHKEDIEQYMLGEKD